MPARLPRGALGLQRHVLVTLRSSLVAHSATRDERKRVDRAQCGVSGISRSGALAGPQAAGPRAPSTLQTVTGPLRRTGFTAPSPRSQRASGGGVGVSGGGEVGEGEVTR